MPTCFLNARLLILGLLALAPALAVFPKPVGAEEALKQSHATAFDFGFTAIEGGPLPLSAYRGHPVLVVNTASFCGFTPQYADLEILWRRYRDRGLVVLGVPSNDFAQEPGSEAEVKKFCSSKFEVDFPLTTKNHVIGPEAHPFYRWIAEQLGENGAPHWNFHKYLLAPDGTLAGAWPSRQRPTDDAVTAAIEKLLGK